MSAQDEPVIEIRDLHKALGGRPVLRGVNLIVRRGERLVILGRSGCGKTVLLKHIVGLLKADRGCVCVEGTDITTLSEGKLDRVRRKIGMLFQDAALFDSMSVYENIAFPLWEHTRMREAEIRTRVRERLALVGLAGIEEMRPEELSGGMKKRVGLARAIALHPEIVLYDEPTSGVDPVMGQEINALIVRLSEQLGVTSVVVTHDVEGAFDIAEHTALLEGGRIVATGTPEEFHRLEHPAVAAFLAGQAHKRSWDLHSQ